MVGTYLGNSFGSATLGNFGVAEKKASGDVGWVPAAVGAGVAVVGAILKSTAVKNFFVGASYDAFLNYYNSVARMIGLQLGSDPKEVLGRIVQAGWAPLYCSDSEGTRNDIYDVFKKFGWTGTKWSNAYDKGWGQKAWYYGVHFKVADAPASLVNQALQQGCTTDLDARFQQTLNLYIDAKHQMKTYGGTADKARQETFLPLALLAIPLSSASCGQATSTTQQQQQQVIPVVSLEPWYKKWWVWSLVGVGVAALGTTGYLLLRKQKPVGWVYPSIILSKKKR